MAKNSFTFNPFTGTLDVVQAPTGTGDSVAVFDTNGDLVSSPNLTYIDTATNQRDLLVAGPVDSTVTTYFGVEVDTILSGQTLGDATFVASYPQIGNSAVATSSTGTVTGYVSGTTVGADATLNSYQGFSERTTMLAGAVAPAYSGLEISPQLNQAVINTVNGTVIGMNLGNNAGNPTIQNVSELAMYSRLYSGATVSGGMNSINLSTSLDPGSVVTNGYTVMNANPQISTAMNSARGVQVSGNYGDGTVTAIGSVADFQASTRFAADAQITNFQELILSSSFEAGATLQSGQSQYISTQFDGQDVDNFTAVSINTQASNATNIDNYQDINISSNFGATQTFTNYSGLNIAPNFTAGASTTSFTGININVNGTLAVTNNPVGLQINMSNATSANRTVGMNVESQSNNIFSNFTPVDNVFFDQGNGITAQMNVLSGAPLVGTDVVCNNMPGLLNAEDDVAYGPFGFGTAFVGFVGQASVATGKTVDGLNCALAGFSIPVASTGGTITDVTMYRGITPFSAGGTLNITNIYGLKLAPDMNTVATNAFNIYAPDPVAKTLLASGVTMVGNSNEVAIKASASTTAAYTLTLPVDDGASGEVLTTDGSGVLSWTSAASGGAYSLKSANYTITNTDDTIGVDTSGGAVTITLPTAVGITGKRFTVIKTTDDSNSSIIATTSGQTVATRASSNVVQSRFGDYVTVVSDGTNYQIVSKQESETLSSSATTALSASGAGDYYTAATSITLGVGQWRLRGYMQVNAGTGTTVQALSVSGLYSADGANGATPPTALSSGANVSQVDGDVTWANYVAAAALTVTATGANQRYPAGFIEVLITIAGGTQAVYMVPAMDYSTAGSAQVRTYIRAERIW